MVIGAFRFDDLRFGRMYVFITSPTELIDPDITLEMIYTKRQITYNLCRTVRCSNICRAKFFASVQADPKAQTVCCTISTGTLYQG
jgi:hypothetical protein